MHVSLFSLWNPNESKWTNYGNWHSQIRLNICSIDNKKLLSDKEPICTLSMSFCILSEIEIAVYMVTEILKWWQNIFPVLTYNK